MLYSVAKMNAGIYIHAPFCRSRCSYCDFATSLYDVNVADRYVSALVREIKEWNLLAEPKTVDTIYFGGGTPSLLSIDQLEQILDAVRSHFKIPSDSEVTIEMNPGDARSRREHLDGWHRLGINRVSFGAQTFNDESLRQLGRTHSAEDIGQTFNELRDAGFKNINFDLIAGLCAQKSMIMLVCGFFFVSVM